MKYSCLYELTSVVDAEYNFYLTKVYVNLKKILNLNRNYLCLRK